MPPTAAPLPAADPIRALPPLTDHLDAQDGPGGNHDGIPHRGRGAGEPALRGQFPHQRANSSRRIGHIEREASHLQIAAIDEPEDERLAKRLRPRIDQHHTPAAVSLAVGKSWYASSWLTPWFGAPRSSRFHFASKMNRTRSRLIRTTSGFSRNASLPAPSVASCRIGPWAPTVKHRWCRRTAAVTKSSNTSSIGNSSARLTCEPANVARPWPNRNRPTHGITSSCACPRPRQSRSRTVMRYRRATGRTRPGRALRRLAGVVRPADRMTPATVAADSEPAPACGLGKTNIRVISSPKIAGMLPRLISSMTSTYRPFGFSAARSAMRLNTPAIHLSVTNKTLDVHLYLHDGGHRRVDLGLRLHCSLNTPRLARRVIATPMPLASRLRHGSVDSPEGSRSSPAARPAVTAPACADARRSSPQPASEDASVSRSPMCRSASCTRNSSTLTNCFTSVSESSPLWSICLICTSRPFMAVITSCS